MGAYILRRLLFVIPTLFGIMVINFTLTQFVPGGPIEQIIAQAQGGGDVFEAISGGGSEVAESAGNDRYVGARGLPQEFIDELEREDKGVARIAARRERASTVRSRSLEQARHAWDRAIAEIVDSEAYRENWRPLRSSIGLMIGDLFFFNDSGLMVEFQSRRLPFMRRLQKGPRAEMEANNR